MTKPKATITHHPEHYVVISEADSEGTKTVYLKFVGAMLGKMNFESNVEVDLKFALTIDDIIILIGEFQKAAAWFHKFMTDEEKSRVEEVIAITEGKL